MTLLGGRSMAELRGRAATAGIILLERMGLRSVSKEPSSARLHRLLEPGLDTGEFGLAADVVNSCRSIVPALGDPRQAASAVATDWPADAERVVERAERLVAGRFDLLGYTALDVGSPPEWHRDPVSGRRAPIAHWSRVPYLDAGVVGDHKVIWELNRHQYLVTLAQAWLLSGDERYAQAIAAHLEGWMDANPPKRGINWASSLEVGFRAIAWIWTLALAGEALPAILVQRTAGMLHVHARHLEAHLSTWFSPNTHLTGEALALVYLGRALPMFRASSRWESTGIEILEAQSRAQVLPDGVYFEQATYYHRYTTDFYLHLRLLLREPPAWLDPLLRRLLDFLAALVRPDGTWPLIGDEDGGRLVWLKSRNPNDFRDTMALGAMLLGRSEYCSSAGNVPVELAWVLGPEARGRWAALAGGQATEPESVLFPHGGYAILRDRRDWLLLEGGPHGALTGGHAHADALAIELAASGVTVLADAGTATYVADAALRDRFRAGDSHSTVTVRGMSPAEPAGPFRWSSRAEGAIERWISTAALDYVAARHAGFARLDPPRKLRREVLWLKRWRAWIIHDSMDAGDGFEAHFHAAPGIIVACRRHTALFRDATANLVRLDALADLCELSVRESLHSPAYGRQEAVQALTVRVGRGRALATLLRASASDLTYARDATGTTLTLTRGEETVEVTIRPDGWRVDGADLETLGD